MQELEHIVNSESRCRKVIDSFQQFTHKYINYKIGLLGAGVMGSIVFGINYHETHELIGPGTAALKQGAYTFLIGGAVTRGCEYLATKIYDKAKALIAATIIPSVATIALTYGMHCLKGTPEPEMSTIPTIVVAVPGTAYWGYRKRKQHDLNNTFV